MGLGHNQGEGISDLSDSWFMSWTIFTLLSFKSLLRKEFVFPEGD